MKLIATQQFTYGNTVLKVGDEFESSSDEDARLLKGFGKARDAVPSYRAAALQSTTDMMKDNFEISRRVGRGKYNRSDMRAKD